MAHCARVYLKLGRALPIAVVCSLQVSDTDQRQKRDWSRNCLGYASRARATSTPSGFRGDEAQTSEAKFRHGG